ncbi:MAG: alanine--glyoxylate aminotransferase family protein [Gammaproteobacteria bacterium]|nr:MAG: alanine--glyoxylate aminotransferase family protein [Gammaproteobacteria bacterium]
MKKERLFTPGPVQIPERVLKVLGEPIIHHRTPEFKEIFAYTRELFKRLVDSPSDNFVYFASSGTGAMEAAVANFFNPGEKVIVINAGKFGERWVQIANTYGLEVIELKYEWGKSVDIDQLKDTLDKNPDAKGVLFQISETSTGAYHDYRAIGELCKDRDTLVVADAITALGVYNIKPQQEGIDILIGGSQKALMLPPGLSILWFSERAEKRLNPKGYYFDVKKEVKKQKDATTAYTPAVSLIIGLRESLEILLEEGMENVEKRHRLMSKATRRAVEELGFKVLPENPAISVTAVLSEFAQELRKEMLTLGVRTAGGQDHLKGKLFRISHMGYLDMLDHLSAIGALELAMVKVFGKTDHLGKGIKVFQETIVENLK